MAKAKREGGLYYTSQGVAVDAEGRKVEDAPKPEPDTDPSKQPGGVGAGAPAAMVMRLDDESLRALGGKPRSSSARPAADEPRREPDPNAPPDPANRTPAETAPDRGTDAGGKSAAKTDGELPTIKDLPDHVASLKTSAEVKAMQKRDDRVSAEPIYKARLAELKEEK